MKRRDLLKAGAIGGGLGITGLWTTACTTIPAKDTDVVQRSTADVGGTPGLTVRLEASNPAAAKYIATYANAVALMKKQPQTVVVAGKKVANGLNWTQQAAVHVNNCPHGTWNFFSWHRLYLIRFEAIVQKITGDTSFVLPYWDWTAHPHLPPPFMNSKSPLYMDENSRKKDLSAAVHAQTSSDIVNRAMATSDFETFMGSTAAAGGIEYGPHNGVHGTLGGTMGVFTSPLDPIFWLHHANVDRLWGMWQEKSGKRWMNPRAINGSSPAWLTLPLNGFYDTDGKLVVKETRTAKDMLDTIKLSYRYDTTSGPQEVAAQMPIPGGIGPNMAARAGKPATTMRAFNKNLIAAKTQVVDAQTSKYQLTFPGFGGKVEKYLNDYLADPQKLMNFEFRLKVLNFPMVTEPTTMQVSFLNGTQEHLLTNYNFFGEASADRELVRELNAMADKPKPAARAPAPHRHDTRFTPDFNVDYKLLLNDLVASRIVRYPEQTVFIVRFMDPADNSPRAVDKLDFSKLGFKLIILENSNV